MVGGPDQFWHGIFEQFRHADDRHAGFAQQPPLARRHPDQHRYHHRDRLEQCLGQRERTTINNQTGATFNFQGSTGLNSNGKTSTSFNNAGTLEQTAGGGTATISFPVTDSGKIESDSGTLEFTGGGSGSPGVVNAGTGAAVILAGTYSGTFTGSGAGVSIFRASRDRRRRSTSPAAPCNGHKRRTDEIWPGPSPTTAR